MVVFTCQHCGDSLSKPKVDKHYVTRCRFKVPFLTCVDCLKDFNDQEYISHTQCISEAERYSAKGTIIKQSSGKQKQAKYIEMIQDLLNSKNLTCVQRQLLESCSAYDNVPRKLKKFQNFITNIARNIRHTECDQESVFVLLENAWKKEMQAKDTSNNNESLATDKLDSTSTAKENGNISNELNEGDSSTNNNNSPELKKKKKQSKEIQTADADNITNNILSEESKENVNVLSKKQLKKEKKYEKYLMELKDEVTNKENEVEERSSNDRFKQTKKKSKLQQRLKDDKNNKHMKTENEMEVVVEETNQKKSKKQKPHKLVCEPSDKNNTVASEEINGGDNQESYESKTKKNKKKVKKSKRQQIELNENSEFENAMEIPVEETNRKKSKKRKLEDSSCEINDKKKKTCTTEDEAGAVNETQSTFDWTDVIFRILESKPDRELSIKRLGKKVIDEYQTVRPDHRSYEELLAKFNKKVKKTKGVRVLKDKAKLLE